MKKLLIIVAISIVAAVFAAEIITGNYNTSGGYQSGYGASGNYVCAYGATAAAMSAGTSKTAFLGTASGAFSRNIGESAAVGHFTMNSASNCSGCIAIGAGAMGYAGDCYNCVVLGTDAGEGWHDRSNTTWINGQIIAYPGRLAINPSPLDEVDESEDPATKDWHYYGTDAKPPVIEMTEVATTNGEYRTRLCLNADEVVITNGVVEYLLARVTHAAAADSSMYAVNAGHAQDAVSADSAENSIYAQRADRATYLNTRAGDPELTAEDVLAMFAAATNRIAALEAALHAVTNSANYLSGGL